MEVVQEDLQIVKDSCLRLPIDEAKGKLWFNQIILDLRRTSKTYGGSQEYETKKYYLIDKENKEVMIPRFYPIKNIKHHIIEETTVGEDITINSNIVPRNNAQKQGVDWYMNNYNGILCLEPGVGKTVISIHSICQIKKKTIIFVHKDSLAAQWKERFLEFTDIDEGQIANLRTSKYKEHLLMPIVISTVQTFCKLAEKPEIRNILKAANFGISIWDECHTSVSAEQFSKTSLYMPTKRVYGLSATPERSDGNTNIMTYHLGDVFEPKIPNSEKGTIAPKVIILKFGHGVLKSYKNQKSKYNYIMHRTKYDFDNDIKPFFDTARYLTALQKSDIYIKKIQQIVHNISKSERNMLFLSDRIKILDLASEVCIDKKEVGFFIPRSKENRDKHLQRRLVFSTYGSARDGTDKPILDCLVLSTPVSNLKQAAGRVVRYHKDKKDAVIIDIVDTDDQNLVNRSYHRIKFYESMGWEIEEKIIG